MGWETDLLRIKTLWKSTHKLVMAYGWAFIQHKTELNSGLGGQFKSTKHIWIEHMFNHLHEHVSVEFQATVIGTQSW